MQSPQNRFNRTFASILPSISKPKPSSETSRFDFQLTNEGCKCQLCQRIIINENLKISTQNIEDIQSELFAKDCSKQCFIQLIQQFHSNWKFKRDLRFCLPEICLYKDAHPYAIIQKKKENAPITINKSKSRLHFFQIQSFFLTGFICHSPTKKVRQSKNEANFKAYINQCITFAKYHGNFYHMMTYKEIQGLFRSKNRVMKNGLMYLQTIVGGDYFNCRSIMIKLDDIENSPEMKVLFERAKLQVRIISEQIKQTDSKYFNQVQEIEFEDDLKKFDINRYLLYLSYKIILISSKFNPQIMKNVIFKYVVIENKVYLFDLRVRQYGPCNKYWSSNIMRALEHKMKKTMGRMQLQSSENEMRFNILQKKLSSKAQELAEWLHVSTQPQWQELSNIRKRLQRLQEERKSLQNSKKDQQLRKSFKMRSIQTKKMKKIYLTSNESYR